MLYNFRVCDFELGYDKAILMLSGRSKAGKDLLAEILCGALCTDRDIYAQHAFGTALKHTAAHVTKIPLNYFYDSDLKDTPLPSQYAGHYYADTWCNALKFTRPNPNNGEFFVNEGMTPRDVLCAIGAHSDVYPKDAWARGVVDTITASEKHLREGQKILHIVTDLRYPHEWHYVAAAFPQTPIFTLLLDPGDTVPGVNHESDTLAYDQSNWVNIVDRAVVYTREQHNNMFVADVTELLKPWDELDKENKTVANMVLEAVDTLRNKAVLRKPSE